MSLDVQHLISMFNNSTQIHTPLTNQPQNPALLSPLERSTHVCQWLWQASDGKLCKYLKYHQDYWLAARKPIYTSCCRGMAAVLIDRKVGVWAPFPCPFPVKTKTNPSFKYGVKCLLPLKAVLDWPHHIHIHTLSFLFSAHTTLPSFTIHHIWYLCLYN